MLKGATSLASFNINDKAITADDIYYSLTLPDGVSVVVADDNDKYEVDGKTHYKSGAELTLTAPEGSYFKDEDNKLVTTENYTMPAADTTLTATGLNLYTPPTITGINFVVDDEDKGYYEIKNADDLTALANYVNNKHTCEGLTFKVVADIDLKDIENWTPLGLHVYKNANIFGGTFDGGNHTISNLTVNGDSNVGLFGCFGLTGTIKNVTLVNANVSGNGDCVGGLVGNNLGSNNQRRKHSRRASHG